jgi:hypothetical protein
MPFGRSTLGQSNGHPGVGCPHGKFSNLVFEPEPEPHEISPWRLFSVLPAAPPRSPLVDQIPVVALVLLRPPHVDPHLGRRVLPRGRRPLALPLVAASALLTPSVCPQ